MINTLIKTIRSTPPFLTRPKPDLSLHGIIKRLTPLPEQALFLGLAEDGLPVLLNLEDPHSGPVLIAGDQACGKTRFLRTIAQAAALTHTPDRLRYTVITRFPEEWTEFQNSPANAGIYSTRDRNSSELLNSLVLWAHRNKGEQQFILLLIDDLEESAQISQPAEQNIRWLLMRGPSRRVWPIVTWKASRGLSMQAWMNFFHIRIFGSIKNQTEMEFLCGGQTGPFSALNPGEQFTLREGKRDLIFNLPALAQSNHEAV